VPGNTRLCPYTAGCTRRLPPLNLLLPPQRSIRAVCRAGRLRASPCTRKHACTSFETSCTAFPVWLPVGMAQDLALYAGGMLSRK
jgi:hypothetical protein